jgi:hypothetical protein
MSPPVCSLDDAAVADRLAGAEPTDGPNGTCTDASEAPETAAPSLAWAPDSIWTAVNANVNAVKRSDLVRVCRMAVY